MAMNGILTSSRGALGSMSLSPSALPPPACPPALICRAPMLTVQGPSEHGSLHCCVGSAWCNSAAASVQPHPFPSPAPLCAKTGCQCIADAARGRSVA